MFKQPAFDYLGATAQDKTIRFYEHGFHIVIKTFEMMHTAMVAKHKINVGIYIYIYGAS